MERAGLAATVSIIELLLGEQARRVFIAHTSGEWKPILKGKYRENTTPLFPLFYEDLGPRHGVCSEEKSPVNCVNNQPGRINHNALAHAEAEATSFCPERVESSRCTMEARESRGLEIASNSQVIYDGQAWIVPSQSSSKKYTVTLNAVSASCTCPDYESHRLKCKHIYAVGYTILRDSGGNPPTPPKQTKPIYRQQWHEYNLAQINEKAKFQELLHDLCQNVDNIPRKPGAGRSRFPLREMIFCAAFKVYSTVSGRRFISDLREAQRRGLISKVPHFNSIFNYFELEGVTAWLKQLIEMSSQPLSEVDWNFAVDSSGFTTGHYKRWLSAKYGKAEAINRKEWVKVHLMCGVKTNVVTAVEVSHAHAGDSPFFKPLVETTSKNFPIQSVAADKAYSAEQNLKLVLLKGGQPYIAFRSNATAADKRSGSVWKRMYHFYLYNQEWFLQHYHRRSNVESTFSMIKAKFGERLRSKTEIAQVNEVLCKILCHNICCLIQSTYELGIDVDFSTQQPLGEVH
jgi:transposase